ncbi:MAG: spinster family MFS transporter [Caulobacterales bacterium]
MTDAVAGGEIAAPAETPAGIAPASVGYRRFALWLLLLVYMVNFLDRQVVNIVAEPIKNELHLKDWQIGAMSGSAFAIFYSVLGIPLARAAERFNRPLILAGCMAIWSGFTALCGFTGNFVQLLGARLGVGIGEAGCSPSAHSMIADDTPLKDRSFALSFYSMGTPLGTLLGFALGGVVADTWGWRAAFFVAGAPGILLAIAAALTLREPRRRLGAAHAAAKASAPSLMATLAYLAGKRTFWLVALFAGLSAFIGYGQNAFIASFYLRNHAAEVTRLAAGFGLQSKGFLGFAIGGIGGTTGALGSIFGGKLSGWAGGKDARAFATLPAIAGLVWVPLLIVAIMAPSAAASLWLFALPAMLGTFWYGPVYGTAQSVVPPNMRATTAAILIFIITVIGLLLGPLCFGAFSDYLAGPMHMGSAVGLKWTFIASTVIVLPAVALLLMARSSIREDIVS